MMTSLTKRLTGKGAGQAMEYKEESVNNMPTSARTATVSIAKKVEDNIFHMVSTPVITLPYHAKNPSGQPTKRPA